MLDTLRLAECFEGVISIEDMRMFGHHRPKPDARMFRSIAARLKVPPHRCTLVEDTLEHQRAARRVGMRTAWMQRYLRPRQSAIHPPTSGGRFSVHPCHRPAYVCARINSLQGLLTL